MPEHMKPLLQQTLFMPVWETTKCRLACVPKAFSSTLSELLCVSERQKSPPGKDYKHGFHAGIQGVVSRSTEFDFP